MARDLHVFIDSAGGTGRSTENLLQRFQQTSSSEMALFRELLRFSFALDKGTGMWKWKGGKDKAKTIKKAKKAAKAKKGEMKLAEV
jgi:hypothetical protein